MFQTAIALVVVGVVASKLEIEYKYSKLIEMKPNKQKKKIMVVSHLSQQTPMSRKLVECWFVCTNMNITCLVAAAQESLAAQVPFY